MKTRSILNSLRQVLFLSLVAALFMLSGFSHLASGNSESHQYLPQVLKRGLPVAYPLVGVNFSPYVDGQNPDRGSVVSDEQIRQRMAIIAPDTRWVRTFGMTNGLANSGKIAHELGMQTALGAWIGTSSSANEAEISGLIRAAQNGEADMVIVGSEVLYRGDISEAQLLSYLQRVRVAVPAGVKVTTADVFDVLLQHPAVMGAVDVVMANYYPYWKGIPLDHAMATMDDWYQRTVEAAGGKKVIVSETGWPSCGNTIELAVPSAENASQYLLDFVSWAKAKQVDYFYFEALDESWKTVKEGPQGACWGIWDKNGTMKPGMKAVFAGNTAPDSWSGGPEIALIHAPAYGASEALKGQVWHVNPTDYRVAAYIKVGSGWWMKPTQAQPLTVIDVSGYWSCNIVTGGNDSQATEIRAYLVPAEAVIPDVLGAGSLPSELDAFPFAQKIRTP